MKNNLIGIFDSGLGGISVLNKCIERMPNENFIYYADKKNSPYGDKSTDEVILLVEDIIENFFLKKNVKAIVIACNTATNATIDVLRSKYDIPIIGTEPAIKPALANKTVGKTLVMATESTVKSNRFKKMLQSYDDKDYIVMGCSGLADLIEQGDKTLIKDYLRFKFKSVDCKEITSIVLGCTHYPFIKEEISSVLNKEVVFYDGGDGVSRRLESILDMNNIRGYDQDNGNVVICSSSDDDYNQKLKRYIGGFQQYK